MQTDILQLQGEPTSWTASIARAAEVLRAGGLVAFPTETVYGLGASALDAQAVAKIFAAKGRPATNPVIVHVLSVKDARALAAQWPVLADTLAEKFWPGPLTLIVKKAAVVPDIVTAGGDTVALRMPSHSVARALLEAFGGPVAAPSANPSETISSTTADHVRKGLDGVIDLILDGGKTDGGLESTVVDLTAEHAVIRRPGLISAQALRLFGILEKGVLPQHVTMQVSPGMHARHYAPKVPLVLVSLLPEGLEQNVGFITYRKVSFVHPHIISLPASAEGYGAGLYAALHALEDAGVERIVVLDPPHAAGWEAVHDRLKRASVEP